MSTLVVQRAAPAGTELTLTAAANGDKFLNNGHVMLLVVNAAVTPSTLTFDSPTTCDFGLAANAAHDKAVVCAASKSRLIGPFPKSQFNDADGYCTITYSSTTTLTVAVIDRAL